MKKIFQLLLVCLMAISAKANNSLELNLKNLSIDSICSVAIGLDSTNSGDVILIAYHTGTAPFSYAWNTGENTETIVVTSWNINYCVTVTDVTGCEATSCLFNNQSCSVTISANPNSGLSATPIGTAPFAYLWSNGSNSQFIQPNAPGSYCVSVTDAAGCVSSDCYWWGATFDSCSVVITFDSTGAGGMFTANASGTAPFTYQWQPSGNTQSIPLNPAYFGDYCVTVTDADGCESTDCVWGNNNPCSVWIFESDTIGVDALYAIASAPANIISYLWSTGETSSVIFPTSPGNYCVTIQGGGCTATACYNFSIPTNFTISGYLYFPDSLNAQIMQGTVELFFNDQISNTWESLGTTDIQSNPNGWSNFYDFGQQNDAGQYIVKATLDPNSPGASDYMPTYHFSTVHWDNADLITLPSSGSGLYQIILNDGSNFTGGSGNINGTVTEGDGFTANDENNRGGDPRPNTSVLLFDSNEQPITHTLTDDIGQYSFGGLPFGTYKLEVEIVGIEQVERWVTLGPNNPTSTGNDFQVTSDGIVLGINDLLSGSGLEVSPNPTSGSLNLHLEASNNFGAAIQLKRLDGTTVFSENQQVVKGGQLVKLDLSSFPTGLYILQVNTGKEVLAAKVVKQ
ncbi:MAG: T9SS type A sorting domain-containing protein [Saprospiraceae bacterium]|nr:T9SS type A sorting domain-containing protein [Saprospiraceae bacterium]MCF8251938.1 T9SS type A sorting domain-containing protein [Saprospiraceae bacterium]MCF8281638.1 T9SS type A sorting domain-containing protein [Bacteroidales bacterium]MCF8313606.1 T9SS type A sorting domain-containing protein [Saprospiraceae bacterium]MCF8442322.1 T9SS type A sorting domain-containing protein [Saprospiraceae bacterium]